MNNKNNNSIQIMSQWVFGFQISQAIHVAAKLSIADLLEEGPLSSEEIGHITKCDINAVYRLLRALACINIFEETSDKQFVNTELSSLLREQHEFSIKSKILLYGQEPYHTWGKLFDSVSSGEESFSSLYNNGFYSHLYQNAERFEVLSHYLQQTAIPRVQALLSCYDFSNTKKLVDVGGGNGCMLMEIIQQYPHIQGVLLDCEQVIASAEVYKTKLELIAGNFLNSVPTKADTYLLSHIIHNWNNEDALKILNNCHKAMQKPGKLLLIESLIKDKNQFDIAKWMDLNMLVTTNGQERSESEYTTLLNKANFQVSRCIPFHQDSYLLEAFPV